MKKIIPYGRQHIDKTDISHVISALSRDKLTTGELTLKFEKKIKTIDLHGASLTEANKKIIEFIYNAYDNGFKKLKIITGKGLRSKISKNPYISKDFGTLQNSVPEFLRKSEVKKVIHKIIPASIKDGGSGAFFIFLKKKTESPVGDKKTRHFYFLIPPPPSPL